MVSPAAWRRLPARRVLISGEPLGSISPTWKSGSVMVERRRRSTASARRTSLPGAGRDLLPKFQPAKPDGTARRGPSRHPAFCPAGPAHGVDLHLWRHLSQGGQRRRPRAALVQHQGDGAACGSDLAESRTGPACSPPARPGRMACLGQTPDTGGHHHRAAVSGMLMLQALAEGRAAPIEMADLAKRRLRRKVDQLAGTGFAVLASGGSFRDCPRRPSGRAPAPAARPAHPAAVRDRP